MLFVKNAALVTLRIFQAFPLSSALHIPTSLCYSQMVPDLNGNLSSISQFLTTKEGDHILLADDPVSEKAVDEHLAEGKMDKDVGATSLNDKLSVKCEKDVGPSAMRVVIPVPAAASSSTVVLGCQMEDDCQSLDGSQSSNTCQPAISVHPITSLPTIKIKIPYAEHNTYHNVTPEVVHSSSSISVKSEIESEYTSTQPVLATSPHVSDVVPSPSDTSLLPESKKVCVTPVEENPYEESESELSVLNKGETKSETKTYMGMTQKTWEEIP